MHFTALKGTLNESHLVYRPTLDSAIASTLNLML